ncbi:MAG: hypothetical protein EBT02_00145 [Planctomycetia bacterium]|nr:hypothetical protein [Planctomycetia bacterium]
MVRIYGVSSIGSGSGSGSSGFPLMGETQGSSTAVLTTDGAMTENSQNMFIIPESKSVECNISIVASTDTTPKYSASWVLNALVNRPAGSSAVRLVGVSMTETIADTQLRNLQISLAENSLWGGLSILCTGISQYTLIKWSATILSTEA